VAVEAAGLGHLDDGPFLWSLHRAWLGTVHVEGAMAAPAMVVVEEVAQKPLEMPVVEDDDVIEAFPADGSDEPAGGGRAR
jgi:hypothetical protein